MIIKKSEINKILVITLSNIGDIILTTPVISKIRDEFPKAKIVVLAGPKGAAILDRSETINEVMIYDKHVSLWEKISLILKLRQKKFDLVIDLRNTAIPFFLWPKYRTSFFVKRKSKSMRKRHLDQLDFVFGVSDSVQNRFQFFTDEEKKSAFRKLNGLNGSRFAVIAPGAGSHLKRWTLPGFAKVLDYLSQKGLKTVLLGDQSERQLGEALKSQTVKPAANLMGDLSLRESAGLISEASLIVANDSAVMHLANELGRPTVAIFGPTNEEKYGQTGASRKIVRLDVDCGPCEEAKCRLERRKCLDDLEADAVIGACEDLLK